LDFFVEGFGEAGLSEEGVKRVRAIEPEWVCCCLRDGIRGMIGSSWTSSAHGKDYINR
jgi:hypothetical protein